MPKKECTNCHKKKPCTVEFFHFRRRDRKHGLDSWCKVCRLAKTQVWALANADRLKVQRKAERARRRLEILTHYANGKPACQCCKEKEIQFLALDHIKGNGHQHRLKVGRGGTFYQWLKNKGLPEGFRVLCHNCNLAIGLYGICPHEIKRQRRHGLAIAAAPAK